jgi:DNA-binding response OmpR family regulator
VPRKPRQADAVTAESRPARPFHLLLVDPDTQLHDVLRACADRKSGKTGFDITHARSLAEARACLAERPADLAMIEPDMPDGSGLQLADELSRSRRITQTIVISEKPSLDAAIQALRAGACDFMVKPLDLREVNERIRAALHRQDRQKLHAQQVRRLRRLCKKLNQARLDIGQQVDILCNDLVTAYQELAVQMQHVVQSSEYGVLIRDELDLEKLLRRSLEYIVEKAGATNVAVFLPSTADEFSLGGYVNYDCGTQSADMLLQHLADVMAPRVSECEAPIHITDNEELKRWIGDDAAWLEDSHVLAFACHHKDEPLAIVALFRDGSQPFTQTLQDTCKAIAPMLGESLAKIIRIHHRSVADVFGEDDALPM